MRLKTILRFVTITVLPIFFISACSDAQNTGDGATIRISLGSQTQALSAHTENTPRNTLSEDVTSVIIRISDARGTEFTSGDLYAADGPLQLPVPAGLPLVITGSAYGGEEILYEGQSEVPPLRPGGSRHVNLKLLPFGTITTRIVKETYQIDVSADNIVGDDASGIAVFSNDNRNVAFHSRAGNLTDNDTNEQIDVFIKDLVSGAVTNVHTSSDGTLGNDELTFADITAAADVVVFASRATNLVADDSNGVSDVFLKDIDTGSTSRISGTASGVQLNDFSASPTISDDGRFIAFYTNGSLTEDGNAGVFLLQRLDDGGMTVRHVGDGWLPRLSGDGNWLIYRGNGSNELWLYDVINGTNTMILEYNTAEASHRINQNGQFVVFETIDGFGTDSDGKSDIYLYNRNNLTLKLLSTESNDAPLVGMDTGAVLPSLADDGRYVTFNYGTTIYVKDAINGEIASIPDAGTQAFISPNGHLIAFNGEDGHLYIAPNPLLIQASTEGESTQPPVIPIGPDPVYSLAINKNGDGQGLVTSDSGIDCGSVCSETYSDSTIVTLEANNNVGSIFTGWGGSCNGTSTTVTITVDGITTCSATFMLTDDPYSLSLSLDGDGGGSVTSSDGNIACGTSCFTSYREITTLTLIASPDENSIFSGWSGDCGEAATELEITVDGHQSCAATFLANAYTLTLSLQGELQGDRVTVYDGENALLTCTHPVGDTQTICAQTIARDTTVSLVPAMGGNNNSLSWTGCSPNLDDNSCSTIMDGNKDISATFGADSFTLNVTNSNGGTVTDNGNQINCGADCEGSYVNATQVTLSASSDAGYRFDSWGGACSGTSKTTTVTMDAAKACSANFVQQFDLAVTPSGNGAGTVTSNLGGIDCPGTCDGSFDIGTTVTLTASAGANSSFTGWSGACSGTATKATVTMNAARSCGANFQLNSYKLTVANNGNGTVTSDSGGISCPGTCSGSFDAGTTVTLTARAGTDSNFIGWSDACSGTALTTTVTINAARTCTANFRLKSYKLTVSANGNGTVVSDSGGISCPGTCSGSFDAGTTVTLTARAGTDSNFVGWSDVCSGTALTTTVTMNAARTCTATFEVKTVMLTVADNGGNGEGTILLTPVTTVSSCLATCDAPYLYGTPVTLTAAPRSDSEFTGWLGDCDAQGKVTMNGAKSCTAVFTLKTRIADIGFPDTELRLCVNDTARAKGWVYYDDVTSLSCSPSDDVGGPWITNLSRIDTLTNLTSLDLSRNQIRDVTPIASLTAMGTLILNSNSITTGVRNLRSLTKATLINLYTNANMLCDEVRDLDSALESPFSGRGSATGIVRWDVCKPPVIGP